MKKLQYNLGWEYKFKTVKILLWDESIPVISRIAWVMPMPDEHCDSQDTCSIHSLHSIYS